MIGDKHRFVWSPVFGDLTGMIHVSTHSPFLHLIECLQVGLPGTSAVLGHKLPSDCHQGVCVL